MADDVTTLLQQIDARGRDAVDAIYPLVYDELRRLAQSALMDERPDHTLAATALVNEAYVRMVDQTRVEWKSKAHFMAIAARAIRRILIDHARARASQKRGGGAVMEPLTAAVDLGVTDQGIDLIDLEQAVERLGQVDENAMRVVEMRFFGAMTSEEAAEVLGVSTRSVERYWRFGRAWLYQELTGEGSEGGDP